MADPQYPSLLILPLPPSSLTPETLKAAYNPPITAALIALASQKLSRPSILDVILPYSGKQDPLEARSLLFEEVERLLRGLYSLICAVCAQNSIEQDGSGGVDARVILLFPDGLEQSHDNSMFYSLPLGVAGPVIDLITLSLTRREWKYIFSIDGEQGHEMLNQYLDIGNRTSPPIQGHIYMIPGGISLRSTAPIEAQPSKTAAIVHTIVAVGGTFDHLHAGHKLLLSATALLLQPSTEVQRRLIIGITGDSLLKNKKYAEFLQSWKHRQEAVVDFLKTILLFTRSGEEDVETVSFNSPNVNGISIHTQLKQAQITIECVEIQDPFGPTITDESVSALVVSGETRSGGAAVNIKREEKGWNALEVFEVGVLDAQEDKGPAIETQDFAAKISSTEIRKRKAEGTHKPSL